jgi:hypothetical protein
MQPNEARERSSMGSTATEIEAGTNHQSIDEVRRIRRCPGCRTGTIRSLNGNAETEQTGEKLGRGHPRVMEVLVAFPSADSQDAVASDR